MNQPVVLSGGGLWVAFDWSGDRWGHRIGMAGSELALLQSIEGSADENWPPSPALQQLHLQPRGKDKQLALLVGMAGTSHWSLSVELDETAGQAVFDVACRVKSERASLGSVYRHSGRIRETAARGSYCSIQSDDSRIRIAPTIDFEQRPRTICWQYVIGGTTAERAELRLTTAQ